MTPHVRINHEIRASELRVVSEDGAFVGVMSLSEALREAETQGLDLVEIAPTAAPPVAKIIDFGKYQYLQKKKNKESRVKVHAVELKTLQVKPGTGEHDLMLKAKKASGFLAEGNRVKIDLFLRGRAKYLDKSFNEERLNRILNLITEPFRIADGPKPSPKGIGVVLEKSKK